MIFFYSVVVSKIFFWKTELLKKTEYASYCFSLFFDLFTKKKAKENRYISIQKSVRLNTSIYYLKQPLLLSLLSFPPQVSSKGFSSQHHRGFLSGTGDPWLLVLKSNVHFTFTQMVVVRNG